MTALAKIEPKTLAKVEPSHGDILSDAELVLLRDSMCRGADETEFNLFVRTCRHFRLNPIAKQIYWFKDKGGRVSTITAADGFRLIAQRTGEYEGQTAPMWCGKDGVWRDVWLGDGAPYAARVGVYRRGFREPLYAVARVAAYSKNQGLWLTMADVLSAKCAEVLALRKAFPNELSGVYATEEMEQAGFSNEPAEDASSLSVSFSRGDIERATKSEAQLVQKNKDSEQADVWIDMIKDFTDAHQIERWCHFNGFAYSHMHANAKGRISTALRHAAKRASLQESLIKEMLLAAPKPIDECDEDGVVAGEVMEGEAAQ